MSEFFSLFCIYEKCTIFITIIFILVDNINAVFKVQLNKKDDTVFGEKVAVQRYRLSTKKNSLLSELNTRIFEGFKELQEPKITFDLFWKDKEEECIRVGNDESLLDAMKEMGGIVFSFYALMYFANETQLVGRGNRSMSISGEFTLNKCIRNFCIELKMDDKSVQ